MGASKEVFTHSSFYFSSIFLKHPWTASRGFQPNSGTQVPHGGFHPSLFIFFSFSFFYFFSFFFLLQGLGGVEAETCSTTITILLMLLKNSFFEKGFL